MKLLKLEDKLLKEGDPMPSKRRFGSIGFGDRETGLVEYLRADSEAVYRYVDRSNAFVDREGFVIMVYEKKDQCSAAKRNCIDCDIPNGSF